VISRQARGSVTSMSPKSPYCATISSTPASRTAAVSSVAVQKRYGTTPVTTRVAPSFVMLIVT
jgi:hypothetical protein